MKLVYLTGLPRSGSTLFSNLLGMHHDIVATPSSPLCELIQGMRRQWSDDPFLLAQLDSNFTEVYNRLERATRAFMMEWSDGQKEVAVDKNRAWLHCVETIRSLFPDFKMIICLRDLRDVFSSIEKQHRKTLLLEFPDHMEQNLIDARASSLFADNGLIGGPVKAIYNVADIPNIIEHLFFLRYEDFMKEPQKTMDEVFKFIGVDTFELDFENIKQTTMESDSYYRFKYPHTIKSKITEPDKEPISPRIMDTIPNRFDWFYRAYYPEMFIEVAKERAVGYIGQPQLTPLEREIAQEIDKEIK